MATAHSGSRGSLHPKGEVWLKSLRSAEHCQHRASCNSRTDNAGNIWTHSMHEQEVARQYWPTICHNELPSALLIQIQLEPISGLTLPLVTALRMSLPKMTPAAVPPMKAIRPRQMIRIVFMFRKSWADIVMPVPVARVHRYDIAAGLGRIRKTIRYTRLNGTGCPASACQSKKQPAEAEG